MKFIISSTALSSHLQIVSKVVNSKNSLPILDCFLFELKEGTLCVTASDSETTMTTSVEVAEYDTDGRFAISARTLLDALRECSEQPLTFDVNVNTLEITVKYQNGEYSMMGQNADEYPISPSLGEQATRVEMDAAILLNGINRTLFATANEELRPVMNGIFVDISEENITMVASDGHILVRSKTTAAKGDGKSSFILPKKPAGLLKNLLPKENGNIVSLTFDSHNAVISVSDYKMVCRLIEGRYPNYNAVIPQNNPYKVVVDRLALLGALRRVSIFSSQASSLIKIHLQDNEMLLYAQDIDFSTSAQESLVCQYDENPLSIGFKATYLIDMLNNMSTEEIAINLADPSRAGIIVPVSAEEQEEDLLMLLMPMMLGE